MFCSNCGKEIDDKAVICVHCGCAVTNLVRADGDKSMLVAVLLLFFLGGFGAHRFYLGDTLGGVLMLLCFLTCWLIIPGIILGIWCIVDLFMLVSGNLKPKNGGRLI